MLKAAFPWQVVQSLANPSVALRQPLNNSAGFVGGRLPIPCRQFLGCPARSEVNIFHTNLALSLYNISWWGPTDLSQMFAGFALGCSARSEVMDGIAQLPVGNLLL